MPSFAIITPSNDVLRVVTSDDPPEDLSEGEASALMLEFTGIPPQPGDGHVLRLVDGALVWIDQRTLTQARAAKIAAIDASRLAANQAVFTIGLQAFRVDPLSRSDIDGVSDYVALFDALPPNWPGGWKDTEGAIYPITTVAEWSTFVEAMVVQGVENFLHAEVLKAAVLAAESNSAVEAVPSW
jgi:hypothetical protein